MRIYHLTLATLIPAPSHACEMMSHKHSWYLDSIMSHEVFLSSTRTHVRFKDKTSVARWWRRLLCYVCLCFSHCPCIKWCVVSSGFCICICTRKSCLKFDWCFVLNWKTCRVPKVFLHQGRVYVVTLYLQNSREICIHLFLHVEKVCF